MRDKILELIKQKGPVVPIDIAEALRIDSVIASAYLSDLVSNKLVGISNLKLGSSPLYYEKAKKETLEAFIPKLHPHEQEAANLLKEKKVLRDATLLPKQRVALRNTKDFAIPLEVSFSSGKEIFWKWYSLTNDQASEIIREIVSAPKEVEQVKEPVIQPVTPPAPQQIVQETPITPPKPEPQESKEIPPPKQDPNPQVQKPTPQPKKEPAPKPKETQENIKQDIEDVFAKQVEEFFKEKEITITSHEVIKAKTEVNFVVLMSTPLGRMSYFVKAKKKKRLNEADITSTYAEGSIKRLPIILLTPGEAPKKVIELLERDFAAVTLVKLEE